MGKFSSKLNYVAEDILNFFYKFNKNKNLIPVLSVSLAVLNLNYAAEAMLNFFYKNKTKT